MVGVEAAQKDLLGYDQAGHELQHLMCRFVGAHLQVEVAHSRGRCSGKGPFGLHEDFVEMDGAGVQVNI